MENRTTTNADAPAMVCPVCEKEFHDIISYADHLTGHSNDEKKRKAEEEKKARENQRSKDIDNLTLLYNNYKTAKKALDAAVEAYKNRYGGYVFPYGNPIQSIIDEFFR